MIGKLRKRVADLYDQKASGLGLDRLVGSVERIRIDTRVNLPMEGIEVRGKIPDISFIVATSHQGLLLYEGGMMTRLIHPGGFYGITARDGTWYAFQKIKRHGRVLSFQLEGRRLAGLRERIWGLSRGIHQLDFIDDQRLAVIDTYDNSLIVYAEPDALEGDFWRRHARIHYPAGPLQRGRRSANYCHFNSVYRFRDNIYLVAHNESAKTGRSSQVYVLGPDLEIRDVYEVEAQSCHNIYVDDQVTLLCDSHGGRLIANQKPVLETGTFCRGLAVSDDYLVVGGSDIEKDRFNRGNANGYVYIVNWDYERVATIVVPRTQVHEIRRVGATDYGLSLTPSAQAPRRRSEV